MLSSGGIVRQCDNVQRQRIQQPQYLRDIATEELIEVKEGREEEGEERELMACSKYQSIEV